ncbi:MAG: ABC transporter ATP-binding protein [Eubacteriales bacterium]|nr:ABC transporter ATP-binding protein [Eubacteriales bacterium]
MLVIRNITKQFGDSKANDNVHLTVRSGEVHALLGENGAGKSTLMNILYGLYKPTGGQIVYRGEEVVIDSPMKALSLGIGMVHQHFMLIPAFKTWENIILGTEGDGKLKVDVRIVRERILTIARQYSLQIDPDARISTLSVGLQQQVEIAKALYRGAELLILDEPTGVLTPPEKAKLFETLRSYANSGHSVIFISHKLDEVMEISDRVTVLRGGKNVATENTADMDKQKLARLMVGRNVDFGVQKDSFAGETSQVLSVHNLVVPGNRLVSSLKGVSFTIRAGEIVGIAGVDGNGQAELAEALTGLRHVEQGEVLLGGQNIKNISPRRVIDTGVALIPEDRKSVGTVKNYTIDQNIILRREKAPSASRHGMLAYKRITRRTDEMIKEYDIRYTGRYLPVSALSGGNLQKVILAREISANCRLLIAMHPTRGLDVGAIEFVHAKLLQAREKGTALLLISSELEEILALADRVFVMCDGRFAGELTQRNITMENIGMLMGGETLAAQKEGEADA